MVWPIVQSIWGFVSGAWGKAFIGAGFILALWYGVNWTLGWYERQIDTAFKQGQSEVIYDQNEEAIQDYEQQITIQEMEKEQLQQELLKSFQKIDDLERQLLVDHDLDKLLQAKPGLTLKSVNQGTSEVFAELEEISND